jgi:hypothetical protein
MWTLAGKTATNSASSHQRPARRVAGCRIASPPAISAAPLIRLISCLREPSAGGTIAS